MGFGPNDWISRRGGSETSVLEPHGENNKRGEEKTHLTRLVTPEGSADYIQQAFGQPRHRARAWGTDNTEMKEPLLSTLNTPPWRACGVLVVGCFLLFLVYYLLFRCCVFFGVCGPKSWFLEPQNHPKSWFWGVGGPIGGSRG